jgi:hypothetical protein
MSNRSNVVTRVRIEFADGSAREVVGLEDCAEWVRLSDSQAALWATRGWPTPNVNWHKLPAPRENPFFAMIRHMRDRLRT